MRTSYATLEDRHWVIDLDPAIAARFKRVFDGVDKIGTRVKVSDTPRNAKDLLWFSTRHPFEFDPVFYLLSQASVEDEREKAVERILSEDYRPSNPRLAFPLRDYQARAVDLCVANKGLLNGDDVGLGKTPTAIGVFARPEALPAVVVTLTSLPIQWEREVNKFTPELRTHIIKSSKPYPLDKNARGAPLPLPDVLIMSYSKLASHSGGKSWAEYLADSGMCRTLIFDEGQELRNNDSNRYRAAKYLRDSATYCMLTTATPVYNNGGEIHNVVEIVQPGTLGTRIEFLREWCGKGGSTTESIEREGTGEMRKIRVEDPVALGEHLRDCGVFLRRTRADVGRELPGIQRVFHHVNTDDGNTLRSMEDDLIRLCEKVLSGTRDERFTASGELDWKLRRATGLSKVTDTASFVRLLVEDGQKVLVYGWHHEWYERFTELLTDEKEGSLAPAFYTGKESPQKKDIARACFIGGADLERAQKFDHTLTETNVLVMSLRAGAGLDGLQHVCSTIVFGELDWSPGVHEQDEGRVYRDGQRLPVIAYYMIADEGSDPVVLDALNLKTEQSEGIRNLNADVAKLKGADPDQIKNLARAFLRKRGRRV